MQIKVIAPKELRGRVVLPSSKSISNRALTISALAGCDGTVENVSDCDDTRVMQAWLKNRPDTIDIGAAGTAMRFSTALLAVSEGTHIITGSERMKNRPMRKRSDEDLEKYNQLVVADEQEVENDYKNEYRGRVQNRKVDITYLPMYELALEPVKSEVNNYIAYDEAVEAFNSRTQHPLYVASGVPYITESKSQAYFAYVDTLNAVIADAGDMQRVATSLMLRAVTYSSMQNLEGAIDDLTTYLQMDSLSVLALWQRAVCQSKLNEFQASQGTDVDMKTARSATLGDALLAKNSLMDFSAAIRLSPSCAYLYYNRGGVYVHRKDYSRAIDDYTQAVALDPNLGEAYYTRGLALIESGKTDEGIRDLSKAGELGLYTAYSLIKKYRGSEK